jgi:tetratricopeptide (TPR) repeat protein
MASPGLGIPIVLGIAFLILIIVAVWLNAPRTGTKTATPTDPDFPELDFLGHLREGNSLSNAGNWQKALQHFKAANVLRPREPSLHFKMGRVFCQLQDWPGAISAFRNALNLNPELLDAHYELARIAYRQEDYPQAKTHVSDALALDSENEACLKLFLKILDKLDDKGAKLNVLSRLSQMSKEPEKYRSAWADTATDLGLYEEALREYETLMAQHPEEASAYQDKIANLYIQQDQYEPAIVLLRQTWLNLETKAPTILDTDGNKVPNSPEMEAEKALIAQRLTYALSLQAEKLLENIDNNPEAKQAEEAAIAILQEALRCGVAPADVYSRLGQLYLRQFDKSKALAAFEDALSRNPYDVLALAESARIEEDRGHYEEATALYEQFLAIEKEDGPIHFALGTLYGIQDKMDLSITHLKKAIVLEPLFVEAHYNLAVALEQKHEYKQATQSYKKVLQLDPTHEKAKSNLAYLRHDGKGA